MRPYSETLFLKRQKIRLIRDWGIVLFYTAFIYITLPIMPGVWESFTKKVGNFSDYLAGFALGVIGLFIIFYLSINKKNIWNFIWLAMIGSAYACGLSILKLSIERVHFIEYGLLSLFVFRALRHNLKSKFIYLWSAIIVFCIGFLDEGLQYLLPNRVYDTKDVIVNGIAGVLGLLLIGLCLSPKNKNDRER